MNGQKFSKNVKYCKNYIFKKVWYMTEKFKRVQWDQERYEKKWWMVQNFRTGTFLFEFLLNFLFIKI